SDLQQLVDELLLHEIGPVIYEPFYSQVRPALQLPSELATFAAADDLDQGVDFLISMGGDGTLLDTVSFVRDKGIPVIGMNFGRLGFLAGIGKEEVQSLVRALIERTFQIDRRSLLHLDAHLSRE